jgi:hypothetical protein
MKRYFIKLLSILVVTTVAFNACDLDINENPNSATGAVITPDLVLPAVIASTAYNQFYYYGYASGAWFAGYQVPGGGISGYGAEYTYNYTANSVTGAWTGIFGDLRDYNSIIKKSEEDERYALFGGIAHIFKAYGFLLLTDAYGDVPYTEGLSGGAGNLSPEYDDAAEVYQALVAELDEAIEIIRENAEKVGGGGAIGLNSTTDPVFGGNYTKWIQFANNVKLRILVRARETSIDNFVKEAFTKFSAEGFIKEDVLVNPGYNATSQQNPFWTVYHSSIAGVIPQSAQYYIPSTYVFTFYDGTKLTDDVRGALVYKGYPDVPTHQLGDEIDRPASSRQQWYIGTGTGTSATEAAGILKSRAAAMPLFYAFETHFLLAEAALYGYTPDAVKDAKTNFVNGITASFDFLERRGASYALPAGADPAQDALDYIEANEDSYLANFDLATTAEQKLEAIITQKYIASNILNSNEAWNEFRRTGYPKVSGTAPATTFASAQSQSPRADRLPVRLIYPQAEYNLNKLTPALTNAWSNPLFWDKD